MGPLLGNKMLGGARVLVGPLGVVGGVGWHVNRVGGWLCVVGQT